MRDDGVYKKNLPEYPTPFQNMNLFTLLAFFPFTAFFAGCGFISIVTTLIRITDSTITTCVCLI